jgi:hypothetical protein
MEQSTKGLKGIVAAETRLKAKSESMAGRCSNEQWGDRRKCHEKNLRPASGGASRTSMSRNQHRRVMKKQKKQASIIHRSNTTPAASALWARWTTDRKCEILQTLCYAVISTLYADLHPGIAVVYAALTCVHSMSFWMRGKK